MAISRAQLLKELLPGLNALFGMEYARYGEEHKEIFETETSERSFEEETKLSGFAAAPVKDEGNSIAYDNAQEAWTARYNHETISLGFSLTEEAIEDNLYDSLSSRYTKALARAMAFTKQTKAAGVLNSGEIKAKVITDPSVAFQAQLDGSGAQTVLGTNTFFAAAQSTSTGSTATGNSTSALDATVQTAAAAFRIVGFVSEPGDAFTDVLVKFNPSAHSYGNNVGS